MQQWDTVLVSGFVGFVTAIFVLIKLGYRPPSALGLQLSDVVKPSQTFCVVEQFLKNDHHFYHLVITDSHDKRHVVWTGAKLKDAESNGYIDEIKPGKYRFESIKKKNLGNRYTWTDETMERIGDIPPSSLSFPVLPIAS